MTSAGTGFAAGKRSLLGYGRIRVLGPRIIRTRITPPQPIHEIDVLGLFFHEFRRSRLDLGICRRLQDAAEIGQGALFSGERELQSVPGRHQVVRGIERRLFGALRAPKSCNLAGVTGDVEIASQPKDLLAMNAFRASDIDLSELEKEFEL